MIFEQINKDFKGFIQNAENEVLIFCPYIQVATLEKILAGQRRTKLTIVTSWKIEDLLKGISQLELYPFCQSVGAYLYINQKIHLKVVCDSFQRAIIGSANITDRGLGLSANSNYECAVVYENLSSCDQVYLRRILQESALIDKFEYDRIKSIFEKEKQNYQPAVARSDIEFSLNFKKDFLISSLPMSIDIDTFFMYYSRTDDYVPDHNAEEFNCAMHDLALYKVPLGLDFEGFNQCLKRAFFLQPFIQELRKFICQDRYFGEIKAWVQDTCKDCPVPSRRDLTGNVQVLYEWFAELGSDDYVVDRPNHSERISPRKFQC